MENYFTDKELSCPCCGVNGFAAETHKRLNLLRAALGFPLPLNSAYRCPAYNSLKGYTQTHATGHAADAKVTHKQAYQVMRLAPKYGFTGIGFKQKGPVSGRFIHLDDLEEADRRPRPHIWSY